MITNDCCYSGWLSLEGYRLWKTNQYHFTRLSVTCSSDLDKPTYWGKYMEVNWQVFSLARDEYIYKYGLSIFDSLNIEKGIYPICEKKRNVYLMELKKMIGEMYQTDKSNFVTDKEKIKHQLKNRHVTFCFVSRFPGQKDFRKQINKLSQGQNNIITIFTMDAWDIAKILPEVFYTEERGFTDLGEGHQVHGKTTLGDNF